MTNTGKFDRRSWRIVASVFIIGHLWAVCGRPLEFITRGPSGPSPAADLFFSPVRGYSEFAYLNHGYAFFAPEPGPSHLVRATIQWPDGDREVLTYPDLKRHWPRLLYHRHFMLTEFLHTVYHPRGIPPEVRDEPALADDWRRRRARYEMIRDSMRDHLASALGAERVTLQRVEHRLPEAAEFIRQQMRLDAPESYLELRDGPPEEMLLPRFGAPLPLGPFQRGAQ